jgi:cytochrome c biogenesis protein CcdA
MVDAPFGLAVAAGMLAAVNPCGFALLPAYLSFLITGDGLPGRAAAVRRALIATAAMTAGFAAVFGVFGLAIAPAAGQIQRHLPWVTIGIGLTLVGLGGWLLAGRSLPGLRLPTSTGPQVTRTMASMATFGAAYAVASLSCTIGPFLAIVVTSFRAGSPAAGVGLFLAYAAGMGLAVAAAALAVALAQGTLVTRLRRAAPLISRLGGLLLLVAGGYVAYYGWWETRVLAGGATTDPVIDTASSVQRWLADTLDRAGPAAIAAIVAVLLAAGLAAAWAANRRSRSGVDR